MVRPNQFSLAKLLIVVTVFAVVFACLCGVWRFTRSMIINAERDYWGQRIREGRVDNPHDSPAATLFTPKEIDAMVDKPDLRDEPVGSKATSLP